MEDKELIEKVLNTPVCIEENNEHYICPFSQAIKEPSKDLEGYNIYTFIIFTYPDDSPDYLTSGFRKMCIDSWKKAFPRMRIVYIDVSQCIDICEWTRKHYIRKSFPTDPLRPLFLSFLSNGIYCDVDVYLRSDSRDSLMLNLNSFIGKYGCSGTFLWNKLGYNSKLLDMYHVYDKYKDLPEEKTITDCEVFARNRNFLKSIYVMNTETICNHFASIWLNIRDNKPFIISFDENLKGKKVWAKFSKESYETFIQYCKDKGYYDKYIVNESNDAIIFC